jgi:hypothetical protein
MNLTFPFLGGVALGVLAYLLVPEPTRRAVAQVDQCGLGRPLVGLAAAHLPPGPGRAILAAHSDVFLLDLGGDFEEV